MLPPGFFGFGHNVLQPFTPALTREVYAPFSVGYHFKVAGAWMSDQQVHRAFERSPPIDHKHFHHHASLSCEDVASHHHREHPVTFIGENELFIPRFQGE